MFFRFRWAAKAGMLARITVGRTLRIVGRTTIRTNVALGRLVGLPSVVSAATLHRIVEIRSSAGALIEVGAGKVKTS